MNALKSLITGGALAMTLAASAFAGDYDVNTTNTGLALEGYDPVAYFTIGEPTQGEWTITSTYNDATYRFSSEENKELFDANPEAYLPQYGGYCAFGAAMGFKFDGDPELWHIKDGELYLNIAPSIQERWLGNVVEFIKDADKNWSEIVDQNPADLL